MIRPYLILLAAGMLFILLETTLLNFAVRLAYLDLLFILVVIVGLFKDPVHGALQTAALGCLQDYFAPEPTGLFMTARLAVFIAAQTLRGWFSPESPFSQGALAFGLGLFDRLLVLLLTVIFADYPSPLSGKTALLLLAGSALNAALLPFIFFLLRLVPGFVEPPRGPRLRE